MKPTQITELFANIRKTFVSFFSILMFVALGVGIFLGISWTAPALQSATQEKFDEGSFHHFQIQFPYGLTDDDLEELAAVEGVTAIEPAYQSFQTLSKDGVKYTVKLQTMGEDIDKLSVVEGELPAKPDEIALKATRARDIGIKLGDTVRFEKDADGDAATVISLDSADAAEPDEDGMKFLVTGEFKVTALVESPEYLALDPGTYGFSTASSGSVDVVAWAPDGTFDTAAFQNGYPVVNVLCDSLDGLNTFGAEYSSISGEMGQRLFELGDGLATARYSELHSQAQKKVDEGEQKIADAKGLIESGEQQLVEGREALETQRAEGEAKLDSAYQELMQYESQRQEAQPALEYLRTVVAQAGNAIGEVDDATASVSAIQKKYQNQGEKAREEYESSEKTKKDKAAYDAKLDELGSEMTAEMEPYAVMVDKTAPSVDHTNYFEAVGELGDLMSNLENTRVEFQGQTYTLGEARELYASFSQQLSDAEAQFAELSARLDEGWAAYYAGREELDARVAEGEQKLAEGEQKVADAKAQVAENEPKLEQAKAALEDMKAYAWSIMPRSYNGGAIQVQTFSDVTTNLSFSMAALFIIVGLLVSYSAVSRIVHEQITQIGTKKALGLRGREITMSFLAYAALAVIVGAIVGTIVGVTLVEGIIGGALGGMFLFGTYPPHFGLPMFVVVTLLELVLVLGATWLACRSILRQHAVELLRGEKPPEGKTRFYEKWGVWEKLPLLTQTIVNNCVNDKRRVFSTIVGVAGCTALIVTALTLNDNVLESYDRHYSDVYGFTTITFLDPAVEDAGKSVQRALGDEGVDSVQALRQSFVMTTPDGDRATICMIVPENEKAFELLYHVRPISGGTFDFQGDGAWVSRAYADHTGAKVGDEITLDSSDGAVRTVKILGFYEFWLTYHEMVMSRDCYERTFDAEYAPNVVLSDASDKTSDEVNEILAERCAGAYDSVVDDKFAQSGNFTRFASVSSAVVLIYIALSVLMAIVVLLNLNVMFIDEKKRELIVLMINGFSVKDAKRYIYNDTIVLTAIGIVLGIVLGCIMGSLTVASIEPSTAFFVKDIDWGAVAIGAVGSAVLAFIMSAIALRRIPRFNLTDINKA